MKNLETQQKNFAAHLVLLKNEAMKLKLYRTGNRLEEAIRMVGYEIAKTPDLEQKISRMREKK